MKKPRNVFLVGPMGVGKTTVGRQLAGMVGWRFEDTDHEVQRRTGVDIPTIFSIEGEEGFREREALVIQELTSQTEVILATGGGAVLNAANRRNLSTRGLVVYLFCGPEQQYERTARDRNRPLLRTEDPLGRLRSLMAHRDPLYREVADLIVNTERRGAVSVAKEIRRRLNW